MDEPEKKKCIFTTILNSCPGGEKSFSPKPLSDYCVCIVIQSSKEREDGFATNFQSQSSELPPPYQYHKSCYSSYTSESKIEKCIKAKRKSVENQSSSLASPPNKRLRSR